MLISVHIPKSAGTSFSFVLRELYRERVWFNYGRIFSRQQARPGIVPAGMACIHGHFVADAFDDLFRHRLLITWLRHPVERVAATYHHFLRTPDMRDDCCRQLYERKLGLREFSDLEWMRDTSSRYVAGKAIDDFAFIGIVERFDESLQVFTERFGGSARLRPVRNVNPARTGSRYALSAGDFEHILSRNTLDLRWYEAANARLGSAAQSIPA